MLYRLYSSIGNTRGLKDYLGYFEIDLDGYFTRYLEINGNGLAYRYTRDHPADEFGGLPAGVWDESEAAHPEAGTFVPLTAALFAAVWARTRCANVRSVSAS
ncbi:hypothetical protein [Massilia sp. TWP1-3-3]|uniref:hypothetical protein n=1 Tax=Massilia sp. TWP1-3-3 TaxID=2804573 RepID=UPI003CF09B10